jgi:hypothetical protein
MPDGVDGTRCARPRPSPSSRITPIRTIDVVEGIIGCPEEDADVTYLQTVIWFLLVSHLLARWHVVPIDSYWGSFATALVGLIILRFAVLRGVHALAVSDPTHKAVVKAQSDVASMSLAQAKREAESALRDGNWVRVTNRTKEDGPVPPGVIGTCAELFERYSAVEQVNGELRIALDLVQRSERDAGFLRIGEDFDDVELAVRPGEEGVYELDFEGVQGTNQTIYHYLALSARTGAPRVA